MIYAKCLLAGAVALTLAAGTTWMIAFGLPLLRTLRDPGGDVGIVVVHFHPLPALGLAILVFAAGFYWEYRRVKQR